VRQIKNLKLGFLVHLLIAHGHSLRLGKTPERALGEKVGCVALLAKIDISLLPKVQKSKNPN